MSSPPNRPRAPSGAPAHDPTRGKRKSLTNVGGPTHFAGDSAFRALLTDAMTTPPGDDGRHLTHAFHAWPARLHPHTARVLVAGAPPGAAIADPFMGGGTIVLEAMLAGRMAIGSDLNPIALEVAWTRTRRGSHTFLQGLLPRAKALVKAAREVHESGRRDVRLHERIGVWFDPPAFIEVAALVIALRDARSREGRDGAPASDVTRILGAALSSVIVKVSRQVSDSVTKIDRRSEVVWRPGAVWHWFVRRTDELARQLAEFTKAVPRAAPEPRLLLGDARVAPASLPPLGAIISSPPYPGVYDYLQHHLLRCAILDLDPGPLAAGEIGSRRDAKRLGGPEAMARYASDLGKTLATWGRALAPGGFAALVVGDGQIGTRVEPVIPLVEVAATLGGMRLRAVVTQPRPTFGPSKGPSKSEHLVLLTRL